ncbi:MAG: hypothetical protein KGJ37_07275, partial [Verrucomicrobiota bacterium]|nr:hypothetical protein [Verrucomicrobiota bacterium]
CHCGRFRDRRAAVGGSIVSGHFESLVDGLLSGKKFPAASVPIFGRHPAASPGMALDWVQGSLALAGSRATGKESGADLTEPRSGNLRRTNEPGQ